jgi:hypothetical protein
MAVTTLVFASAAHAETVALWLFDEPAGSSVALDSSGNGHDLTIGPDAAIVRAGKFGGALDADATAADGLGAFRYCAERALNPGDENWTLEAWIKAKPEMKDDNRLWGLSGVNYIDFGRTRQMPRPAHGIFLASRYLPIDQVLGWNRPTGDLKADDAFHHVAFVYDSARKQARHYFDGKQQFAVSGVWKDVPTGSAENREAILPPHYPMLQVGMRDAVQQWSHRSLGGARGEMKKFQGYIDELRFSNVVLYATDFTPPSSLAAPGLVVHPRRVALASVFGESSMLEGRLLVQTGTQPKSLSATSAADWLVVDAPQSQAAQFLTLRVATDKLAVGRHEATVTLKHADTTIEVPVSVTINKREDVRNIGDRRQLFIDRRFIEQSVGVTLRVNPAEKFTVAFDRTKSHSEGLFFPKNVFYDDRAGRFRLYYLASGHIWCMESTDGVNWEHVEANGGHIVLYDKPAADAATAKPKKAPPRYSATQAPPIDGIAGGRVKPMGTMLIYDPRDVPERRYKFFQEVSFMHLDADGDPTKAPEVANRRQKSGVYAYYSADGLTFVATGVRVLPVLPEGLFNAFWDEAIGRYAIYMRCENIARGGLAVIQGNQFIYRPGFTYAEPEGKVGFAAPETGAQPGLENLRSIARLEADDLLKPWTVGLSPTAERDSIYATAGELQLNVAADEKDGFLDFYTGYPLKYPYAEDVHLMLLQAFRHFHPSRQPWFPEFNDANGPLQGVLAVSRDGKQWDRLDRSEYVPLGLMDEWDRHRTVPGLGMIRVGSYLYQYYWGGPWLHDSVALREEYAEVDPKWTKVGIGGMRQRLDGFVSAEADYRGGHFTTPPLVFSGRQLVLNQNSGGQGTIFVELRDLAGNPIPGYTLGDCEEVSCNDVHWPVRWRGSADVSSLAGRPVRIHLRMTNAKLYSFEK